MDGEVMPPNPFQFHTVLRSLNKVSSYTYKGTPFTFKGSILSCLERIPNASPLRLSSTTPSTATATAARAAAPTTGAPGAPTTIRKPLSRVERDLLYEPIKSSRGSLVYNSKNHKTASSLPLHAQSTAHLVSARNTPDVASQTSILFLDSYF